MSPSGACIYALIRPPKEGVVFEERPRDFIPHTPTPYLRATTPYRIANVSFKSVPLLKFDQGFLQIARQGFGMKVINYICCVLVLTCLMNIGCSESPQNQDEQQLLDAITADETFKMKRPFCNAFTGCGRKRNFQENQDTHDLDTGSVRLPISVYKNLLKNIRNAIERERNDYRLSDIPRVYLSGRMPLHKRFDIRSSYP